MIILAALYLLTLPTNKNKYANNELDNIADEVWALLSYTSFRS
ncbi:protein of unknown function [Moritella yayanosii]|uniref:Uncharacterized protein n=1 Tax=Moritella yayanosii TaxID=69539 RepID=A0A330LQS1_9GAMM|nr:protein of unknown function [Moritella yayanosii]